MGICDKAVFNNIFLQWNESVQRFVLSRGISTDESLDIVQDCFIKLWQNCADLTVEHAGPFLLKVARNLSVDQYRKAQVRLKYKKHLTKGVENQDGQFLLEESEFKEKVERAIASMPEKSREVFILNRFDKKTYKEIANSLEISVKAVEKRMSKALAILAKQNILKKR